MSDSDPEQTSGASRWSAAEDRRQSSHTLKVRSREATARAPGRAGSRRDGEIGSARWITPESLSQGRRSDAAPAAPTRPSAIQLRPYQADAIQLIESELAAGRRAVLLQAATGSGKTIIAGALIRRHHAAGRSIWVLVHRAEIAEQFYRTLIGAGFQSSDIGHVKAGSGGLCGARVQICSVQSLVRRIDRHSARLPDLLIVDECHHAPAQSYRKIIDHVHAAGGLHVGLTATPSRLDGKPLGDIYSTMVCAPSIAALMRQGYLARCTAYAPPTPLDLGGLRIRLGDYERRELDNRTSRVEVVEAVVDAWERRGRDLSTLAFAVSVRHAQMLTDAFRRRGYRAECAHGKLNPREREAVMQRFRDGRTTVLVSVDLIGEGFDVPDAQVCVMSRPTHSTAVYLQQAGRVLRPKDRGERAIILDMVGNVGRHGLPDAERDWTLEGDSAYGEGPHEFNARTCPECHHISAVPLRLCAECGFRFAERAWSGTGPGEQLELLDEGSFDFEEREVRTGKTGGRRRSKRGSTWRGWVAAAGVASLFIFWPLGVTLLGVAIFAGGSDRDEG